MYNYIYARLIFSFSFDTAVTLLVAAAAACYYCCNIRSHHPTSSYLVP